MYLRPAPRKPPNKLRWVWVTLIAAYLSVGLLYYGREKGIAPALVSATPTPSETLEQRLAKGDKAFAAGNMSGAEESYQRAAIAAPNSDVAMAKYAMILVYRRKYDDAVRYARSAVAADPRSAANYAILTFALDWDTRVDEAIAAGTTAIDLDPAYSDSYAYLAEAYADRSRPDRALEMARQAVDLAPNSWLAQRNLAYAYEHLGKYKTAVDTYRRAIELFPSMAVLYMELAQNLRQIRLGAEADAALLKASDLDPTNPEIHDTIGRNLYDHGKMNDAQVRFKRAIEVDPSYALGFAHLAWTYYAQRQYEEAIPNFEEAIKKGATNNEFNYELGLSYAFLLQCDKANIWLDKALAIEPDSQPARDGKVLCDPNNK